MAVPLFDGEKVIGTLDFFDPDLGGLLRRRPEVLRILGGWPPTRSSRSAAGASSPGSPG
ncbi:MAG: hypothetical protein U0800_27805 [Isosphaeraceae bacterium]